MSTFAMNHADVIRLALGSTFGLRGRQIGTEQALRACFAGREDEG